MVRSLLALLFQGFTQDAFPPPNKPTIIKIEPQLTICNKRDSCLIRNSFRVQKDEEQDFKGFHESREFSGLRLR